MIAIIMLIRIMFTQMEKAKNIQAAISFAALRLEKLNFPIAMLRVFLILSPKSLKFLRSLPRTK